MSTMEPAEPIVAELTSDEWAQSCAESHSRVAINMSSGIVRLPSRM